VLQNESVTLKRENFDFFLEKAVICFPKLKLVLMASKQYGLMNVVLIVFYPCNCFEFNFFPSDS